MFARRLRALLLAAVSVTALAACSATPAPVPSVPTGHATASASGSRLPDPHSLTGPSTARSVAEVQPLARSPRATLPVTVTDVRGRSVTIADTSRILALDLYGTLADTVVALGLGDRLVGRGSSNTLASMADLPVVTHDGHELSGEAILSLRPSVVLTDTTLGPLSVQEQVAASGVPVVFLDPKRSISSTGDQVRAVAHALGVDAAGDELARRVAGEIADAKTRIAAMAPADPARRLRMAFLYVRGTAGIFFVLGKGSGADELIDGIGGIDVATQAGITGIKPATSEALLATDPEVILVMTDGLASTGGVDGLLARPGVAETTAGRNRRVVDMADGQVLSFGPTTAAVLLSLARAVYEPGS